ncbi:MAG: cysteine desulfurase [Alphaproteobacteria bacterium]
MNALTARPRDPGVAAFDVEQVRADFPILVEKIHGRPLVYLDTAASAQKPRAVIEAEAEFYATSYANIHRGVHTLSQRATDAYEGAREKVRAFLNARHQREVIFVRGATEGINLVAQAWGRANLERGDEVLITHMEHHSNIVPWQMLRDERGIVLKVAPINDRGELDLDAFFALVGPRTRLISVTQVANALGTVVPVATICRVAREKGITTLIDGCQAVPHLRADVQALGCDFYVFSGHKLYGPSGIGVLYGRDEVLGRMPPWQGGGDMIASVTFEKTIYADLPNRFEAGTPNIAGTVGLGAAIDYLTRLDFDRVAAYEADLLAYGTERLSRVAGLTLVGTARDKAGVLGFTLAGIHPHDVGTILDQEGVAVRVGHHCAQPVMDRFGVPATVRASLGLYNTRAEIDALVTALGRVREMFG